jgi:hypothetical protein
VDWSEARLPRTSLLPAETERAPNKGEQVDDDPIVHAQLKRILRPRDADAIPRREKLSRCDAFRMV